MTDQELVALLRDIESDRVERKASLSDRGKIRQVICAFANDLPNHQEPGVLFIGASDNGTCANLPITDELLQTLASMRSDGNILPFPSITVQKRIIDGCELAVVIVEPSDAPPVRYDGRTWIRVGPRRAIATPEDERRLAEKRRFKDLPFDLRPMSLATLDDLDLRFFTDEYLPEVIDREVLAENQRSVDEQLSSVRFINNAVDKKPTVLGILVAGKDPRQWIPGAYVQFLRIDGGELGDPIKDQKEVDGYLSFVLDQLDSIFRAHISTASDLTQAREIRHSDYPIVALRELVRNAVLHRSYEGTNAPIRIYWFDDRIEIHNPGGPFGQVTRENFGNPGVTDYRNPHLAEAMKNLRYVQRFGVGISLARRALQENGNPPPEFVSEDSHVAVTLRRRS